MQKLQHLNLALNKFLVEWDHPLLQSAAEVPWPHKLLLERESQFARHAVHQSGMCNTLFWHNKRLKYVCTTSLHVTYCAVFYANFTNLYLQRSVCNCNGQDLVPWTLCLFKRWMQKTIARYWLCWREGTNVLWKLLWTTFSTNLQQVSKQN